MKTKFKEIQQYFQAAKFQKDIILKQSDSRLGKKCQIFREEENGAINPLTDCYSYGEMKAYLTGLKHSPYIAAYKEAHVMLYNLSNNLEKRDLILLYAELQSILNKDII